VSSVLWVVVPLIAVGLMYWLSFRIEPHWVSKDGQRLICTVQPITGHGDSEGRAKEAKILVHPDGRLQLSQRRFLRHTLSEYWRVAGKTEIAGKRKVVYVLNAEDDDGTAGQLALRLPDDSKAIPTLDALLARPRNWNERA
jgi:hypothetical protein